jgi:hypothetical protein
MARGKGRWWSFGGGGPRRRMSRPVGCLVWLIALLVLLIVLSLLFGGFQRGTKVGLVQSGVSVTELL